MQMLQLEAPLIHQCLDNNLDDVKQLCWGEACAAEVHQPAPVEATPAPVEANFPCGHVPPGYAGHPHPRVPPVDPVYTPDLARKQAFATQPLIACRANFSCAASLSLQQS